MSIPKEPEQVMKQREGSVLGKKTILKSDHFPGCHNKRLTPHIDGAPNYRQADSSHVHGVAIPTIDGIQNVLSHIGKRSQVLWINLREEPEPPLRGGESNWNRDSALPSEIRLGNAVPPSIEPFRKEEKENEEIFISTMAISFSNQADHPEEERA